MNGHYLILIFRPRCLSVSLFEVLCCVRLFKAIDVRHLDQNRMVNRLWISKDVKHLIIANANVKNNHFASIKDAFLTEYASKRNTCFGF